MSDAHIRNGELDRLAERAARTGSVRVIVGLNQAARAVGELSPAERTQQQAAIRAAQRALVDRDLTGTGSRVMSMPSSRSFRQMVGK